MMQDRFAVVKWLRLALLSRLESSGEMNYVVLSLLIMNVLYFITFGEDYE